MVEEKKKKAAQIVKNAMYPLLLVAFMLTAFLEPRMPRRTFMYTAVILIILLAALKIFSVMYGEKENTEKKKTGFKEQIRENEEALRKFAQIIKDKKEKKDE